MSSFGKKTHEGNKMKVFTNKHVHCKCGNPRGIRQVYCTVYDSKGEKETSLVSEEIVCENCKKKLQ